MTEPEKRDASTDNMRLESVNRRLGEDILLYVTVCIWLYLVLNITWFVQHLLNFLDDWTYLYELSIPYSTASTATAFIGHWNVEWSHQENPFFDKHARAKLQTAI